MSTDRNEALRLAEFAEQISNEGPMIHTMSWSQLCGTFQMLADLARQQAERIAELEAEREKWKSAEHALSGSYVRVREAIGAMRPPSLETAELWGYVEQTAQSLTAERDQLRIDLDDELRNRDALDTMLTQCIAERDQLRAEVERLRKPTNPLEDSVVMDEFCRTPGIHQFVTAFKAGVRFAERAHMIGSTNANQA